MILDGKKIAHEIQQEIKNKISSFPKMDRPPCLTVILVGDHEPSKIYISRKTKACESVGIKSVKYAYPTTITENELVEEIQKLNHQPDVDGILVQLPLPKHISTLRIMQEIAPSKDVDGFHPHNVGLLLMGESSGFVPCTPLGIKTLLQHYSIDLLGKQVLIVGRSNIVGKPLAALLMQAAPGANATVTIAHRYTKNLSNLCLQSDVIIAAMGHPQFIKGEMIKEGGIVIDVGINKIEDLSKASGYRIVGDVDFDSVAKRCSYISPVPGGIGPMTIAMLLSNTFDSFNRLYCKRFNRSIAADDRSSSRLVS